MIGDVPPGMGNFVLLPSGLPKGATCFIADGTGANCYNSIKCGLDHK